MGKSEKFQAHEELEETVICLQISYFFLANWEAIVKVEQGDRYVCKEVEKELTFEVLVEEHNRVPLIFGVSQAFVLLRLELAIRVLHVPVEAHTGSNRRVLIIICC